MRHLKKIPSYLLIATFRFYQYTISPLLGSHCRHYPTCSNYAVKAVKDLGFFKGGWLAVKRISKCHPWGTHGIDPVPEPKEQEKNEILHSVRKRKNKEART